MNVNCKYLQQTEGLNWPEEGRHFAPCKNEEEEDKGSKSANKFLIGLSPM
jgi:hypothetical protein